MRSLPSSLLVLKRFTYVSRVTLHVCSVFLAKVRDKCGLFRRFKRYHNRSLFRCDIFLCRVHAIRTVRLKHEIFDLCFFFFTNSVKYVRRPDKQPNENIVARDKKNEPDPSERPRRKRRSDVVNNRVWSIK